jgi:hypothetical protein
MNPLTLLSYVVYFDFWLSIWTFESLLLISTKACWDFIWDCTEFVYRFGKNSYLNSNSCFESTNMGHPCICLDTFYFCHQNIVTFTYRSCTYVVRFLLKYFIFGVWHVFLILNSNCALLRDGKTIYFCILIFYPVTLLSLPLVPRFNVDSLEFST